MENGEVMMKGPDTTDESGYSEKKLDQNVDLQAGQWLDLQQDDKKTPQSTQSSQKAQPKKTKDPKKQVNLSKQPSGKKLDERLISAIDGVTEELQAQINEYLKLVVEDIDKAEVQLRSVIELQTTQKSLLQALKWEAKGSLDITKLPKQVQNLLK